MTVKIDRGVVSEDDPKPTRANGQLIIENIIARAKESIGGAEDFATTKVLSSDILTIGNDHCVYEIGGEGGVADELKAINYDPSDAIRDGMVIGVFSSHVITFKNGVSVAKKIFTRMRRDTVLQDANTIIWFKYKLSADAWYQVFPDLSAQFDLLLGARPVSTLTIVSSQVTVTAALHLIDSGSAMDVDQMLHGTEFNGSNLIGICTANADYVRTMRHDQGTNGKLNLLGAASIPMAQGSWYFFERTVSGANTIWVHRFTIGGAVLAKSTAAGKLPIGDGSGGWIESGGTLAKGSIPVGSSGSAFGYLAVGTNGHIPYADSTEALGIKWAAPGGGGGIYGDGADGAKTISTNTTETVPKIFRLTTLTIQTGCVWTVKSGTLILVTGAVDIQGTGELRLAADIAGVTPIAGAYGAVVYQAPGPAGGTGYTTGSYEVSCGGGGCGGNGGNGGFHTWNGGGGGKAIYPYPGATGSAGAALPGGNASAQSGSAGPGGGSACLYSGSTIVIGASAKITANGGAGGAQSNTYGAGGGGGSGGIWDIGALTSITNSGTIECKGGAGGNAVNSGYYGAGGGGGIVCLTSPSITAGTITLTGGAKGSGGAGFGTSDATAGSTGVTYSTTAIPVKYRCF